MVATTKMQDEVVDTRGGVTIPVHSFAVHFGLGRTEVDRRGNETIRSMAPLIQRALTVTVHGFTDSQGSPAANERVARGRARSVASLLQPLAATPVAASHSPLCCYEASGTSEVAHAANRRAVVVLELPDDDATRKLAASLAQPQGAQAASQ